MVETARWAFALFVTKKSPDLTSNSEHGLLQRMRADNPPCRAQSAGIATLAAGWGFGGERSPVPTKPRVGLHDQVGGNQGQLVAEPGPARGEFQRTRARKCRRVSASRQTHPRQRRIVKMSDGNRGNRGVGSVGGDEHPSHGPGLAVRVGDHREPMRAPGSSGVTRAECPTHPAARIDVAR